MAKRILFSIISLILSLTCVLTSCDFNDNSSNQEDSAHTHSYGKWEITQNATCSNEGKKERYCACGEKQITDIPTTEHNITNGLCDICGYVDATVSSGQAFAENEWISAFDNNNYQSYLMEIDGRTTTQSGYSETIKTTIQFNHPYYKIFSLGTEGFDDSDGWINTDESSAFLSGDAEDLQKIGYIPYLISSFYESFSELSDLGYSKFIYNKKTNVYSSNLFDEFENVEITFENNLLSSIIITKEYCDIDYGDTIETYTLKLSDVNSTPKPEKNNSHEGERENEE